MPISKATRAVSLSYVLSKRQKPALYLRAAAWFTEPDCKHAFLPTSHGSCGIGTAVLISQGPMLSEKQKPLKEGFELTLS